MRSKLLQVELEEELCRELEEIATRLGIGTIEDALRSAATDWLARRKGEIADRDPAQRYFVNEALDELIARKR